MERIEMVRTYILLVGAAAGAGSMRARKLAQRLASELGYTDPVQVKPAVALEPALVEIEKALDGAQGDMWG